MKSYYKDSARKTANIMYWMSEGKYLNELAHEFMNKTNGRKKYIDFLKWANLKDGFTPDGTRLFQTEVSYSTLNKHLVSFVERRGASAKSKKETPKYSRPVVVTVDGETPVVVNRSNEKFVDRGYASLR